ncbi:MAG: hypothetical protein J6U92_06810 [Clostridia bacterium]|nr:hypothetical protein [Clostridia bacterium]
MKEKTKKTKTISDFEQVLIKKALGYDVKEVVEEYVNEDGEIRLTKKKVTKKNVPPDLTALKILLNDCEQPLERMSDEDLENEKNRLLKLLEEKS